MRELTINIEDSILKNCNVVDGYDELDDLLKGLPSYQDNYDMDQITKEDYDFAIRKMQRKPMKGIEKWL